MHRQEKGRTPLVAVCIPTADRAGQLEQLLATLPEQTLPPDIILIVDASLTNDTELMCRRYSDTFATGCLQFEQWHRGLTLQRRRGIELLQELGNVDYVCMLDDDVILAPDFLQVTTAFMQSEKGLGYGAVSGYELLGSGKEFSRLQKLYHKLGIYDGELRPGRWLYCGDFLEMSTIKSPSGISSTEFVAGGYTLWGMEVFDQFLPPVGLIGYRGGEDKHLSLRASTTFRLGMLREAELWHYHVNTGARPGRFRTAYLEMRNKALMLRDCDPHPTVRRYLAFLGFNFLHLLVRAIFIIGKLEFHMLSHYFGSLTAWIQCVITPPRCTQDALCNNLQERNADSRSRS